MSEKQLVLHKTEHRYVSERLSAYVDYQLSGEEMTDRECARIEAHLRTCNACRQDLRTLRWTKDLLRAVPAVPIPRSFLIREADVVPQRPVRRGRTLFSMQWATAAVALLLAIVLVGDAFTSGWLPGVGWRAAAPQEVAREVVVTREVELIVEVTKEVELIVEVTREVEQVVEAEELAVVESEAPQTEKAQEEPAEKARAAEPEARAEDAGTATHTPTPQPAEAGGEVTPTPAPAEVLAPAATPAAVPMPDELVPTETPTSQVVMMAQPEVSPTPESTPPPAQQLATRPKPVHTAWRIAEIGLGAVLIGMAGALIWLRRQA